MIGAPTDVMVTTASRNTYADIIFVNPLYQRSLNHEALIKLCSSGAEQGRQALCHAVGFAW